MRIRSVVVVAAVSVAGCSMGIQPGGEAPSVTYTVPRSYQTVFLRAQNQADECLRGKSQFAVRTQVDAAQQSGVVSVVGPLGNAEVARTELKAVDAQHTQVTQTVWGRSPWDANALNAMRESVRMDTSVCVAYQ
ncbi:MAG TPA: hypothetical protein VIP51_09815 [Eoetvoesiella sp.]